MDGFYEEDERILGHAADAYHRIDVRRSARHLTVHAGDRLVADTRQPLVLFESGFAPRWYVPREHARAASLAAVQRQTFCPYKGLCSYYDIDGVPRAGWAYLDPYPEVEHVRDHISFEPDKVTITLDGEPLHPEPGQHVVSHGPDRGLTPDEVASAPVISPVTGPTHARPEPS
jgi:uncharacterized protein (DUF427 family)